MPYCNGVFDLEAIETLASTSEAGVFSLSAKSWLVLQAAMTVIEDYEYWQGQWGNGEALTDAERSAIDEIAREIQQGIDDAMTFGTMSEQDADSVNIDGGTIDNTAIGPTLPATVRATSVTVDSTVMNQIDLSRESDDSVLRWRVNSGGAATHAPTVNAQRTRGTRLAPTAPINGDFLFEISVGGHNGSVYVTARSVWLSRAAETWGLLANGTRQEWQTTQIGTTTPTTKMILHDDGRLELKGTIDHDGITIGFNGRTPQPIGDITGSRGGNVALANLLTYLAARGDIVDNTTP